MVDQIAGDDRTAALPDGTDTVIEGASKSNDGGTVTAEDTALVKEREIPAPRGDAERPVTGSGTPERGLAERFRSGREQLSNQAGEKARGLVSQGLERTSEALANVSKMIGDTAPGIDDRLGGDYGDYARRAAGAIENVANTIASKDPDELIEDTRNFVRNSPGIALAGAAVVGFVVARLLKSGLARDEDQDDED
ncbi:MAG: hypothetical protein ACTHJK_08490 [Sphingomicrobium sp.]|jgi:ElaB/YqjD/DUF883 family membrane-anchored ribosome-binding protein